MQKTIVKLTTCKTAYIMAIFLTGCATAASDHGANYELGRVLSVAKVQEKDITPSNGTAVGAATGFGGGAIIGGTVAGLAGAAFSVLTLGGTAPLIPVWVAAGAAIGGGSGALLGGGTGYAVDYYKAGSGIYEYKIEQVKTHEKLIIRQVEKEPLEKGSLVHLIWDKERRIAVSADEGDTVIEAGSNKAKNAAK